MAGEQPNVLAYKKGQVVEYGGYLWKSTGIGLQSGWQQIGSISKKTPPVEQPKQPPPQPKPKPELIEKKVSKEPLIGETQKTASIRSQYQKGQLTYAQYISQAKQAKKEIFEPTEEKPIFTGYELPVSGTPTPYKETWEVYLEGEEKPFVTWQPKETGAYLPKSFTSMPIERVSIQETPSSRTENVLLSISETGRKSQELPLREYAYGLAAKKFPEETPESLRLRGYATGLGSLPETYLLAPALLVGQGIAAANIFAKSPTEAPAKIYQFAETFKTSYVAQGELFANFALFYGAGSLVSSGRLRIPSMFKNTVAIEPLVGAKMSIFEKPPTSKITSATEKLLGKKTVFYPSRPYEITVTYQEPVFKGFSFFTKDFVYKRASVSFDEIGRMAITEPLTTTKTKIGVERISKATAAKMLGDYATPKAGERVSSMLTTDSLNPKLSKSVSLTKIGQESIYTVKGKSEYLKFFEGKPTTKRPMELTGFLKLSGEMGKVFRQYVGERGISRQTGIFQTVKGEFLFPLYKKPFKWKSIFRTPPERDILKDLSEYYKGSQEKGQLFKMPSFSLPRLSLPSLTGKKGSVIATTKEGIDITKAMTPADYAVLKSIEEEGLEFGTFRLSDIFPSLTEPKSPIVSKIETMKSNEGSKLFYPVKQTIPSSRNIGIGKIYISQILGSGQKSILKADTSLGLKNIQKQMIGTTSRSITRISQKQIANIGLEFKTITLTQQRLKQRQRVRQETELRINIRNPFFNFLQERGRGGFSSGIPSPEGTEKKKKKKERGFSFDVYLRRFGKDVLVGKSLPRGRALRLGVKEARQTLGATFKLKPSGIASTVSDIPFRIPASFRTYRIQKGRRVPLKDTYIQKRGFRLSSPSEVSEIMGFRARSGNGKKRKKRSIFDL